MIDSVPGPVLKSFVTWSMQCLLCQLLHHGIADRAHGIPFPPSPHLIVDEGRHASKDHDKARRRWFSGTS
jgi:hypothetical protein